ncbi:unnamed protein product [Rotaria sp. Silwood1]|nr:unnamed protein product [Rotaria sp. Silwood1]
MSKENLEMLQSSVGKFISINSFLLANIDSEKTRSSLDFAKPLCDIERVFFVIKANPEIHNTKPFNNIQSYGYFQNPNEILFMVGSIFRIEGIERPADQIWNIRMTLCSINDQELKSLLEHMKKNLGIGKTNLIQFSNILYRMRKLNNAEKYSRRYLNQLPNGHPDIANCYQTYGKIAESKKEFALSLKWYKRSLDIFSKTLKSDDPNIAEIYNNMANVYSKINDYTNAMNSYQKVLEIWKKIAGDKHPYVAQSINNIGAVHEMTKKYSEALDCYRQALKILKNSLSSDHPDIAMTHRNIAYVHELKVIYIGAAPGIHINYLSELFPDLEFVLIDTKKVETKKTPKIHIRSGEFIDDIVKEYSKSRKELLLICDIHAFGAQDDIDENLAIDMVNQKEWHLSMKPSASLLTLHFSRTQNRLQYFEGDLILEPWGSRHPSGCRLVVQKGARMIDYNIKNLKSCMDYFQNVLRTNYYEHDVKDLNTDGLDHCYDCRSEIFILSRYLEKVQKISVEQIPKTVLRISEEISKNIIDNNRPSIVARMRTLAVVPKK